jgi:hypothetical protein
MAAFLRSFGATKEVEDAAPYLNSFGAVKEYIRSFGASKQVEEETPYLRSFGAVKAYIRSFGTSKHVEDASHWQVRKDPCVADDLDSATTDVGSSDSLNISTDEFQHFYRRLSDLQSSQTNVCQEEHGRISDGHPIESPKQKIKTPVAQTRRVCSGKERKKRVRSPRPAQHADDTLSILADQIY